MELKIRGSEFNSFKQEIVALHNGEEVVWNIGSLDKVFVETKVKFDMFEHINAYWEYLDKNKQDSIFLTYKTIRALFDDGQDRNQLTQNLYNVIAHLLDQHDLDDVMHWIKFRANNIIFPDSTILKTEYIVSPDRVGTREQTYLLDDYQKLIAMALVLRSMVPVWCDFIGRTRQEAGTNFKEYYAFRLIGKSKLAFSEPMNKLRTYVEYSTVAGKDKAASIIGGISSEDFPFWILGLVVTRKVCVGDIRGFDNSTTLITYIYNFIHQKVSGVDNSFNGTAGIIKAKSFEELSEGGEKNLSRLEGYKVKQEIPAGDIVAIEFSVTDPFAIALKLEPTIDLALLESSLKTTELLSRNRITESHISLLQQIMKPVVSPRGIRYLQKATIVRLLAVTQAVLWHRGHKDLAGLSTAITGQTDTDEMQISGVDSRARIPKEMVDELNILFPFMKRPSGKQKTQKMVNAALISIDSLTDHFSSFDWVLTIEDKFVKELTGSQNQRRYSIPHDIKVKLAVFALQNAKQQH